MLLADSTARASLRPSPRRQRTHAVGGRRPSAAVIIGGGPAGLLAAHALAPAFDRMVILERGLGNAAGDAPTLLFAGSVPLLEELCPGMAADLAAAGGVSFDASGDFRWTQRGRTAGGYRSGIEVLSASRRLLSAVLRRRLAASAAVEYRRGAEVVGLDLDDINHRIRGVFLQPRDGSGGGETWLGADLVVDAGGRQSQVRRWLRRLGLPVPQQRAQGREIAVTYQVFRWQGSAAPAAARLVDAPGGSAALYPIEDGRWVAVVGARTGFDARFAPALAIEQGALAHSLRGAVAEGPARAWRGDRPSRLHLPKRNPWAPWPRGRRAALPAGLVSLGGSLATFDPVFDPGVSVAVATAHALRHHIAGDPTLERPARWWRRAAPAVQRASRAAAIRDLDPAEGRGRRLLRQAVEHAVRRPALGARVFRVWQLVDRPAGLWLPALYGSLRSAASRG